MADATRDPHPERGITTVELVAALARRGIAATAIGLRQDIHRGLVSPEQPEAHRPRPGYVVRWTPAAVRRVIYMSRLRQRAVNGHVLPLLLWLRDGWGWERIRPAVAAAARRAMDEDFRHVKGPRKLLTEPAVLHSIEAQTRYRFAAQSDIDLDAAIAFRQKQATETLFGIPSTSVTDYDLPRSVLLLQALGADTVSSWFGADDPAAAVAGGHGNELSLVLELFEESLAGLAPTRRTIESWLSSLDAVMVERGRHFLIRHFAELRCALWRIEPADMRRQQRAVGAWARRGGPLTLFGETHPAIDRFFYTNGRWSAAGFLASGIACTMIAAHAMDAAGISVMEDGSLTV